MYNYFCKPTSIEIYRKFKRSLRAVYENLPVIKWIDLITPSIVLVHPSKIFKLPCENRLSVSFIASSNESDQAPLDATAFDIGELSNKECEFLFETNLGDKSRIFRVNIVWAS